MAKFTRRIKILWHGEYAIHTGFGNASKSILDRLYNAKTESGAPKYELHVMSLTLNVDPVNGPPQGLPYKVYPMYGNRAQAPFGHDYAADLVRRVKPDIVVSFGDTWMIDFWNEQGVIPADLRKTFKLLGYVAIDGYPVPDFWIEKYQKFDKIVTFTKFGKDAIEERAKQIGKDIDVSFIHHGVNPQVFKPLPQSDIDNFKRSRGIGPEKKIIGMFSRNQPRKHHPEFIEFAQRLLEVVNNSPDYLFYFHTMERDAGWDLPGLIRDIDTLNSRNRMKENNGVFGPGQVEVKKENSLLNRFIFPGIQNPAQGYPEDLLNMMYNICDAHVLLTSGEGFGMTVAESLSAGIPTFTNDYAAAAELVKESGGGDVIKARDYTYRGSDHNFYRPHTDYDDAVTKVLNCVNNEDVKKKYKKRGRAWGLSKSWDIIVDDWVQALDSLYDNENNKVKAEVL